MAKYYVKVVGRPFGPIEAEKIVQMVSDGKLSRESEVSANRLDWFPLGEVAELRQALNVGLPTASPFGGAGADDSDARVWYVTNDGVTQYGPMTQNEILQALQSGQLQPTASAWRNGEQARPISEISAFRPRNAAPAERKEWYYSSDGRSGYGPYAVSEILAFVEQGRANFDSLVWRLGENSRAMRDEPAFINAYNAGRGGTPMNAYPVTAPAVAPAVGRIESLSYETANALNRRLRRWHNLMWISYVSSFACFVIVFFVFLFGLSLSMVDVDSAELFGTASGVIALIFGSLGYLFYWFSFITH